MFWSFFCLLVSHGPLLNSSLLDLTCSNPNYQSNHDTQLESRTLHDQSADLIVIIQGSNPCNGQDSAQLIRILLEEEVPTELKVLLTLSGTLTSLLNTPLRSCPRLP
jgi:hypothetical protein